MLTTNQRGLVAETKIVHECISRGIGVSRPLDDERYDLILDLHPKLVRVQCKWGVKQGEVVAVTCRTNRRGPNGFISRRYGPDGIDAIAIYCLEIDACYLLPPELSVGRSYISLRLAPTRNRQRSGSTGLAISSSELHWRGFKGP